ncbi:MAG TPA: hypothetical protein DEA55_05245 [Rhodospirillaceae bacterium]|nr:hypothetical protein [Rhodospirillaceae bacterium]
MTENFLVISGHDYRSSRRANIHFIASELVRRGSVRFFSVGFSSLSKIKKDPRLSLWDKANSVERSEDGVECYLWRTALHPVNLARLRLSLLEGVWFKLYARHSPAVLRQWIAEADTIIIESGAGIIFFDLIKTLNPDAKIIYRASDALGTIGCAGFLQEELTRIAPGFDGAAIPSPSLASEFPEGTMLAIVPHGIDKNALISDMPSPYPAGTHLVSVGSMLFDPAFFEIAASAFPDVTFHIIGAGKGAEGLGAPNIRVYGEMPFVQTLPYLKHANAGIAPYAGGKVEPYLADTSMKLIQFGALGLPAICPDIVVGGHKGRFGYRPGDSVSIGAAIKNALAFGRFEGAAPPSWADVAQSIARIPKHENARTYKMHILASPAFSNRHDNPYNALLYEAIKQKGCEVSDFDKKLMLCGKHDILHMHWPDLTINRKNPLLFLVAVAYLVCVVALCKIKGTKIVWTVHNLLPHDVYHKTLTRKILHWFAGRCDGLIFLSGSSREDFRSVYPLRREPLSAVVPHGHYKPVYPQFPGRTDAREKLGLPAGAHIALFFGQIRRYKNVEKLITEFSGIKKKDSFLLVAGSVKDPALKPALEQAAQGKDNIRLDLKFIPDEDIPYYFAAADIVVLPYTNILNSGAALLALSFDRPVVVPALGSLRELQEMVGSDWVRLYEGEINTQILERHIVDAPPLNGKCPLKCFNWDSIADKTIGLYQAII